MEGVYASYSSCIYSRYLDKIKKKKMVFGIYIIDNKKKCWEIIKRNNWSEVKETSEVSHRINVTMWSIDKL